MEVFNKAKKTAKAILPSSQQFKRITIIGTKGASKTTVLGCLGLTCDVLSMEEGNFKHFIDERSSGICQVPADLQIGIFPEPTPPGSIYEADLYITLTTWRGEKTLILPCGETSGEDIENLIGPYQKKVYEQAPYWEEADNLAATCANSSGYILVLPVNRARIPGISQMDPEPTSLYGDPDVNLRRILTAIQRYKMKNPAAPPTEGVAVLLAKYDMVDNDFKRLGMDLYNDIGAHKFLTTYFRQTSSVLKFLGFEKVRFFPVHVEVKKVKRKDGTLEFLKRADGRGYDIALNYERNLPMYSEQSYKKLIYWLFDTFS